MSDYLVTDPHNGQLIQQYPTATDQQVEESIAAASAAYQQWSSTTTVAERAALAQRVGELFHERKQELARIINREMGKPVEESIGEVELSGDIAAVFAKNAEQWLANEPIETADEVTTFFRYQGTGVLLGIMPWNYPYYQVARFALPNLVLGNTVILKHAEQCPESALAIAAIIRDAGFPEGAYVNLFASHDQISTIIADPRVQGISLTGSERAGSIVAEQAGKHLKKCVLELGGSDPFLVLDTDSVDYAVEQAVVGRMENTGQACNGSKRIIVLDEYFDEFATKFTTALSQLSADDGDYGPLSSTRATETLRAQVAAAVQQGATLLLGDNAPEGNAYAPAVLTGITPDMEAYGQEFFGPVAQLYRAATDEEAIQIANDSPYGLGSVIICDDHERATRAADQLDVGMVFIGSAGLEGADVPFGGVKRSGYGRELGRVGMLEFANKKLYRVANK